jgi:hypothetical protein
MNRKGKTGSRANKRNTVISFSEEEEMLLADNTIIGQDLIIK